MNIPHLCTSLELSKRLKELWCKQDSLFYWVKGSDPVHGAWAIVHEEKLQEIVGEGWTWLEEAKHRGHAFSAYTAGELGELLPEYIIGDEGMKFDLTIWRDSEMWNVSYWWDEDSRRSSDMNIQTTLAPNEADARAAMLIYLLTSNLITLTK